MEDYMVILETPRMMKSPVSHVGYCQSIYCELSTLYES